MSESKFSNHSEQPFYQEEDKFAAKERKDRQNTLNWLGVNFNVCWDAWQVLSFPTKDFTPVLLNKNKTFNEKAFFEAAAKLDGMYKFYLESLLQEAVAVAPKVEEKKYLASLIPDFINKLEFFSRINFPTEISVGGKTKEQIEYELEQAGILVSESAKFMIGSHDFIIQKDREGTSLVRLKVHDLFPYSKYEDTYSFEEVCQKAQDMGLELCTPETGLEYRLVYLSQPVREECFMAMEQIIDEDGNPSIFELDSSRHDGLSLRGYSSPSSLKIWYLQQELVFRLPAAKKSEQPTPQTV